MSVYDESRNAFVLGKQLAKGGQGVVWRLAASDDYLVKIYHSALTTRETAKHRLLRDKAQTLKTVAALPMSLAFKDSPLTHHVGVFIPFVPGVEIFELYGTRSRLQHFPRANFKFLVRVAYNLAVAFEQLHAHGIVVGDVNEQNIKVLPDATVRFIDTDSFQIRGGTELFTSDVGTPLWTAPELHGRNLTGLERTSNHDLFALAQLIFLILFAGRHPFSGVPKTNQQLLPEEAIRLHAFAFAPPQSNLPLGPPPGSPRLEMLPHEIREAFQQAFLKSSIQPNARPTASRWRQLMDELSKKLVTCAHNPSHVYSAQASKCPWCVIVREVGVDVFPPQFNSNLGHIPSANANNDSYILRLSGLRPHPFAITNPPPCTGLRPSPLPKMPSGFWSGLHQFFSPQGWKRSWLAPAIDKCKIACRQAEASLTAAKTEQRNLIAKYNQTFAAYQSSLNDTIRSLRDIAGIRARCLQDVKAHRREAALLLHLQKFRIRQHKIPQIGPARQATILSFGIETAAEINQTVLSRSGIPSNAIIELLAWRKKAESRFTFNANLPLSPLETQDVERRVQEQLRQLKANAAAIEVKINEATQQAQLKLRPYEPQIHQLNRQLGQARIDLHNLENEMNKN